VNEPPASGAASDPSYPLPSDNWGPPVAPPGKCPRCWSPNPMGAGFCSECGMQLIPGAVPPRTNRLAVVALVSSLVWIFGLGSLVAVILGFVALGQIKASNGAQGGRTPAMLAIVFGSIMLALVSLGLLAAVLTGDG
jgi:hypothetical protein